MMAILIIPARYVYEKNGAHYFSDPLMSTLHYIKYLPNTVKIKNKKKLQAAKRLHFSLGGVRNNCRICTTLYTYIEQDTRTIYCS